MALGDLIIQERLQQSDRETVETIIENPYLHTLKWQIVVASELSSDTLLNEVNNVRHCMEERMKKEK
jgi:hypothetical protein